ncbi:uncharacterized protein LOC127740540 [Arachis duranensis]|uniref:Uncharacterized protein LOC127740540 n=1 Tax=Arachis duranensis TaxID=130453 RepID=A0A9C6TFU3_ARADU|nr:uncharacterized protein LOC127740540 [Arachis duranensis]
MWQCHYLHVTLRFCSPRLLVLPRFSHMALSSVDFSLHRLHASSSGSHFSGSTFFCVTAYDLCGSAAAFLLRQGLPFRGNDETDDSVNQGNFLELLNFLAQHNEEIDRAFKNACGNLKLRAPSIKKDIVRATASETTKAIVNDLGDELFAVLVDETRDISIKEQISVCLRYVNKEGQVRKHFLGLVHVSNTNALSLKLALESLLEIYNLSLSRLALVTVAKKQAGIALLFNLLTNLCNVVGALCKRRDMLGDSQMTKTIEALQSGEISSGRGLNQEIALKRAGDTRWDVRSNDQFSNLNGIDALSQKLVETQKNIIYPLVFLLLKLALVLPVATASVERTFSTMNIIKSRLQPILMAARKQGHSVKSDNSRNISMRDVDAFIAAVNAMADAHNRDSNRNEDAGNNETPMTLAVFLNVNPP